MQFLVYPIVALSIFIASAAKSQEVTKNPEATGAITPQDMSQRLEQTAARIRKSNPAGADRATQIDFVWAENLEEYRSLARFNVVLVVAVSKNEKELPLKRVFIRDKEKHEFTFERISSERRDVPKDSPVYSVLGRYREDSFYLAPSNLMKAEGQILADFATNRTNYVLYNLPGDTPDFIKADPQADRPPSARPDPRALKAILLREYAGFKLPDGLR